MTICENFSNLRALIEPASPAHTSFGLFDCSFWTGPSNRQEEVCVWLRDILVGGFWAGLNERNKFSHLLYNREVWDETSTNSLTCLF